MCAEHWSKFAALYRQWWRLHMSEKFSSGTINSKQTNTQLLHEGHLHWYILSGLTLLNEGLAWSNITPEYCIYSRMTLLQDGFFHWYTGTLYGVILPHGVFLQWDILSVVILLHESLKHWDILYGVILLHEGFLHRDITPWGFLALRYTVCSNITPLGSILSGVTLLHEGLLHW